MESSSASSPKKHPIFNNEWEILSTLGEGTTSKVFKAKNLKTGNFVALKLLNGSGVSWLSWWLCFVLCSRVVFHNGVLGLKQGVWPTPRSSRLPRQPVGSRTPVAMVAPLLISPRPGSVESWDEV